MMERSKGQVKPVSGALELIRELRSKGLKMAIGTSSQRELAHLFLSELGLKKMFKVIVTLDDVKNGKPDPEIFLLAAEKLQVAPEECVVIEDGRSGMQAAKAAEMKCVGLVGDRSSKDSPADILVESLKELIDFNFNNLL
jgi:HAD superfamily hydrolase (TIGR01509 family)